MYIEKIDIGSFGNLKNVSLAPGRGVNIIEGGNESGKSTVAAFIKFIFYGFDGKPERKLRIGFASDAAEGAVTLCHGDKRYRIERRCTASGKDEAKVFDLDTNRAEFQSEVPGEVFFGINSDVFLNTAFVSQLDGGKVNGRDIGEAAANILFSADESVNLQRTLKKIDEARIQLLHKNQKGGRIYELNEKYDGLRVRLLDAKESNKEIIDLEGSSEETKRLISENTEKIRTIEGQLSLYEAHVRRRKKRSIEALREELENKRAILDELKSKHCRDGFIPTSDYISELKSSIQEAEILETKLSSYQRALETANEGTDGKTLGDGSHEKKEMQREGIEALGGISSVNDLYAKSLRGRKKNGTALFIFTALFAVSFAGALVLGHGDAVLRLSLFAAAALLLLGSIVFLTAFVVNLRRLSSLFDRLRVSGTEEMAALLKEASKPVDAGHAAFVAKLLEEHENTENEIVKVGSKIEALCLKFGEGVSREQAITMAENAVSALYGGAVEVEKCRAAYESALAQYDGEENEVEETELAPLPENFDFKSVKREYDFLTKATDALREKRHNVEVRLSGLRAKNENPAELAERLSALEAEISRLKDRHDAYQLAHKALSEAGAGLRDTLSPRLSEHSGRVMAELTNGKYNDLGVDRDMELTFFPDSGNGTAIACESKYMSAGTLDAAYISLRMALINLLCRNGLPPMVFDESFSRFDDKRLAVAMDYLCKTAEEGEMQILVFTSSDRESRLAENNRFERIAL